MAFKRPKNIKDVLVKTDFHLGLDLKCASSKCRRNRCSHCLNIVENDSFTSSQFNTNYNLNFNTNCSTSDVIYLITCKKCSIQYVGQTSQQVSKRMNSHRFDINNFYDPLFSTHVATHFNTEDHCLEDFSFMPIDIVHNNMNRLLKETYWIHKLGTEIPNGLNAKVLYDI